jgi:hypothetical protein
MTNADTALRNVEDGYAEVHRTDSHRRIGTVTREKTGSGRTSTSWFAYSGRNIIDQTDTRTEAIAALVAHVNAQEAARAAFYARY